MRNAPVAMIGTSVDGHGVLVVCDNGAVFKLVEPTVKERHWVELLPIPDSRRAIWIKEMSE